jgi:putative peptidoglycan lipid II flippase
MTSAETNDDDRVLANSAVMAAGTAVSRVSGFVRSALLAAALGLQLHADLFNVANTIPNMLYILLAGGVFNAVLVPQLVRAMTHDEDGGEAYTNRVVTLAALFLGGVTVLLVVLAPWVLSLYLDPGYDPAARASAEAFARLCLPQVFFYGMFVLVGQILNSRRRFGPMMWAPIANNVIAIATLVIYLVVFGPASAVEQQGPYTTGQELLLGIGSTLGIAAQLLILIPYLRSAGFSYRPRFDFRGTGLGHTLRLGIWTVLFVVVNQIALAVVVNLGSSGVVDGHDGTGYSVYTTAFLIVMVPHSVVTVSLATAILPRLSASAAAGDLPALARLLSRSTRSALAIVLPFAALLPLVAPGLAALLLHGAAADDADLYVPTLALFGPGVLLFTVHYMLLRGFYALEQTRTIFWNQCWVAATNIVLAIVLVRSTDPRHTAPSLVVAYAASYLVGSVLSYVSLRRRLNGLDGAVLLRFVVRLLLATLAATGLAWVVFWGLGAVDGDPSWPVSVLEAGLITAVDVAVFVVLARAMRLDEVTAMIRTVTRRVPVPGRR